MQKILRIAQREYMETVKITSLLTAVGSICNTIKETQGLMMPIMMVFIIPLLACLSLNPAGETD